MLRSKVDNPDLPSHELAGKLSTTFKRPITGEPCASSQRSRSKFVGYLFTEVRASLDRPTEADLEEELIDLNLFHYCRPYMKHQDGQA